MTSSLTPTSFNFLPEPKLLEAPIPNPVQTPAPRDAPLVAAFHAELEQNGLEPALARLPLWLSESPQNRMLTISQKAALGAKLLPAVRAAFN